MVGPTALWLLFFLLIPMIYVVYMSFMTKGLFGGIQNIFTFKNYKDIFSALYLKVTVKSIKMAFQTSIICLLISYPFAYMLSRTSKKVSGFLMLLLMLPFWVNGLIRLNGWSNILRDSGFVNTILMKIGVIDAPIQMRRCSVAWYGLLFASVYGVAVTNQHI